MTLRLPSGTLAAAGQSGQLSLLEDGRKKIFCRAILPVPSNRGGLLYSVAANAIQVKILRRTAAKYGQISWENLT
jgi:hypothetical protein